MGLLFQPYRCRVHRIAGSFTWPFRGPASRWIFGIVSVLILPILFIPLLGYAIAATRAAEQDPAQGLPRWSFSGRLLADGFWTSLVVILTLLPFALALNPLADALHDVARGDPTAHVLALLVLALPWGLVALLLLPHGTAAYAASGKPGDLFNFAASVRRVRQDFATWNVVVGAIVTGWAIGLACAGLFCVGIAPGIFYAILVSAHAAAALQGPSPRLPAG